MSARADASAPAFRRTTLRLHLLLANARPPRWHTSCSC